MPLNYSKWDMLELSDDSDIEEHPNVDKKSMIRWKQRDIKEKREARKLQIAKLNSELSLNAVLRPRIESVITGLASKGVDYYRAVQRRLRESPSDEKPATGAPNQPTYDMMMAQLLGDVFREAAWLVDGAEMKGVAVVYEGEKVGENMGLPGWADGEVPEGKKESLGKRLEERLGWHVQALARRDEDIRKEIEHEEAEMKKKITSDDIHEGFDATTVAPAKPSVWDEEKAKKEKKEKEKGKKKVETIEVLNPKASTSAPQELEDTDDEDVDLELTPAARAFVQIGLGEFEKSFEFIKKDSSVLSSASHDAILAEAFAAERRGDKALAQRCVHQSLLNKYCRELGKDGAGRFFQQMISKNPKSVGMFSEDFMKTYQHIATRTAELAKEEAANPEGQEQIQLVATDPTMQISFNLPEGPPPDNLTIEGEGAEELDIEQVKAFLQRKWEIFEGFPDELRNALLTEKLDEVNKVLGAMRVSEAEEVVELMQEGGMLSFSERGVRDMTKPQ